MTNAELLRRELELQKVFKTEYKREQWKPMLKIMGILSDRKIAKRMGVTIPCVVSVRSKLKIAPVTFPKSCERYGAKFESYLYTI